MKIKLSPITIGLLQTVGLIAYIACVATFMQHIGSQSDPFPKIVGTVLFLTLFVFSALVSGSIMLGYPLTLISKGKIKEALHIIGASILWLFAEITLFITIFFLS